MQSRNRYLPRAQRRSHPPRGLYPGGTAGGDQHHRYPDGTLAAGDLRRQGKQPPRLVHEQPAQFGAVHLQYHTANRYFVGYVEAVGNDCKPASWAVSLFPYIDRNDLWIQWSCKVVPNCLSRRHAVSPTISTQLMTDSHPEAYIEMLDLSERSAAGQQSAATGRTPVNGGWADSNDHQRAAVPRRVLQSLSPLWTRSAPAEHVHSDEPAGPPGRRSS